TNRESSQAKHDHAQAERPCAVDHPSPDAKSKNPGGEAERKRTPTEDQQRRCRRRPLASWSLVCVGVYGTAIRNRDCVGLSFGEWDTTPTTRIAARRVLAPRAHKTCSLPLARGVGARPRAPPTSAEPVRHVCRYLGVSRLDEILQCDHIPMH